MLADIQFEDVDGMPVAHIRGEIDMSNVDDVGATLRKAVGQSAPGIVVDFTQTDYIDSAGLHFVFELGKRLRDRGQRLMLTVPSQSPVTSVLDIVRIDVLAQRYETLDLAVERLRAHAADVPPLPPV